MKVYSQIGIFFVSLLIIGLSVTAYAQEGETDSSGRSEPDSLASRFIRPIPLVGALDRYLPDETVVTDSAINGGNYKNGCDLVLLRPGVFTRDFGSLGLMPDFTIGGLGGKEILFLSDGIPLDDPLTGLFNPYLYPVENIERIEIITGARAFLYGLNGTGGAVNFVSKSKKAIRPYSRIRYSESGYGFGIIDGMVSQDIIRGLNVTMGAQHTVYGMRFRNENYDCWNARIKARFNINDAVNVFASEMYNQSLLGMYGGIDTEKTPEPLRFESLQATVRNSDAYEKLARHDFQVGAAARLLPDSDAVSMATIYYTSFVRGYRDLENLPDPNGIFLSQFQHVRWWGVKLTQNLNAGGQRFDLGTDVRKELVHMTPAAEESGGTAVGVFGKSEMQISMPIIFSPYARFDSYRDQNLFSYGGDVTVRSGPTFKAFGGYSRSYRIPVYIERTGIDTLIASALADNAPERHHFIEIGIRWSNDWLSAEARSYHRTIWNVIEIDKRPEQEAESPFEFTRHRKKIVRGFSGALSARLGSFYLDGVIRFLEAADHDKKETIFPKWSAAGGIYYWDDLIPGHLNLKAGIDGKAFTSYYGEEFNLQAQTFLPDGRGYEIPQSGVIDLVVIARIGRAYIHFIMDNLLDGKYIMTAFYPMPERQMRFGVSWEFLN